MMKPLAGLLLLALAAPASAATLDGDTIDITAQAAVTGLSTSIGSYTVPTGNVSFLFDPSGHGSIAGNVVNYTFGQLAGLATLGFSSVTFTDTNPAKTITGVSYGSGTTAALEQNTLSFTSDSFTLSFANVTAQAGDVINLDVGVSGPVVGTVPLPAAAPLFGAALLLLGSVGYGVKRARGPAI